MGSDPLIHSPFTLFGAIMVVDAYERACEGEYLTEGSQYRGVDDARRWYEKGSGDETYTEGNKHDGE